MSTDNKDLVDSSATNEGQNTYTDNSNHLSVMRQYKANRNRFLKQST